MIAHDNASMPTDADNQVSVRARLIYNPRAGHIHITHMLDTVVQGLCQHGWQIEVMQTTQGGDATRLAAEAVEAGLHVVIVAGGDGTINEALQALVGTRTALAVIPLGTVNVWAREIGLLTSADQIVAALVHGRYQCIDVGRANDRYFLMMGSVGFDARVVQSVSSPAKRRWGPMAYLVKALSTGVGYVGQRTRIVIDDDSVSVPLLMMVVGNTRRYAGPFEITSRAVADDGVLDVSLLPGNDARMLLLHIGRILLRRHTDGQRAVYRQARTVRVYGQQRLSVQIDGEPAGMTPVTFSVVPASLWVIVPPNVQSPLFTRPAKERSALS